MALFSKRHYEWLANHQRSLIQGASTSSKYTYISATYELSRRLKTDNPAFDIHRFLQKSGEGKLWSYPSQLVEGNQQ